jgi:hypothetical protein
MALAVPLLKTKRQTAVKVSLKYCIATLSGVIAGREDKLLEKPAVKKHLRKLIPVVTTLQKQIEELDILNDKDSPTVPKKPIILRPGDNISSEAQIRLTESTLAADGTTRMFISEEISPMERDWEEAEFHRVVKDHKLEEWNENFYGEIGTDFTKYHAQVSSLKKVLTTQAQLQIAPIVPAAKSEAIFRVPQLIRAGVKVKFTAGYPVFEDQLVLGINTNLVADTFSETSEYKKVCRGFKNRIAIYAQKFGKINVLETYLKELRDETVWINEQPAAMSQGNKVAAGTNPAAEARVVRLAWLEKEISLTEIKVVNQRALYIKEYVEYGKLIEEYSEVTKAGRSKFKGQMADMSVQVYAQAEKCLAAINARLGASEKLVFVCPQGTMNSYVTYFWVMRDSQFGQWSGALCFSKLKLQITDWCFPKKSQSNKLNSLEQELETHQNLIEYVHGFVRREKSIKFVYGMSKKWLALRRIKFTPYYATMVTKIYKEAPEIMEMSIKIIKLQDPNIGKTLMLCKR